jgi:hypothetical protein
MAGNSLSAPTLGEAFCQTNTADVTAPNLEGFSFNMEASKLFLTFDEMVSYASVKPNFITLQAEKTGGSSVALTFTSDSVVTVTNGRVMELKLTAENVNEIKAKEFAKTAASTFLHMTADAVWDMAGDAARSDQQGLAGNSVTAILTGNALQCSVSGYTADTSPPVIGAFSLALNDGELSITFNEPVEPESIEPTRITLHSSENNEADPTASRQIAAATVKETDPATVLTFVLSDADMSALKSNGELGTDVSNLFLSTEVGVVQDTSTLDCTATGGMITRAVSADSQLGYGVRFQTGIYTRECHWIPRLFA